MFGVVVFKACMLNCLGGPIYLYVYIYVCVCVTGPHLVGLHRYTR